MNTYKVMCSKCNFAIARHVRNITLVVDAPHQPQLINKQTNEQAIAQNEGLTQSDT